MNNAMMEIGGQEMGVHSDVGLSLVLFVFLLGGLVD